MLGTGFNEYGELGEFVRQLDLLSVAAAGVYQIKLPVRYRCVGHAMQGRNWSYIISSTANMCTPAVTCSKNHGQRVDTTVASPAGGEHRYSLHWENVYDVMRLR